MFLLNEKITHFVPHDTRFNDILEVLLRLALPNVQEDGAYPWLLKDTRDFAAIRRLAAPMAKSLVFTKDALELKRGTIARSKAQARAKAAAAPAVAAATTTEPGEAEEEQEPPPDDKSRRRGRGKAKAKAKPKAKASMRRDKSIKHEREEDSGSHDTTFMEDLLNVIDYTLRKVPPQSMQLDVANRMVALGVVFTIKETLRPRPCPPYRHPDPLPI
eukprot:15456533-Alexandrium_andersonii.AAC.1